MTPAEQLLNKVARAVFDEGTGQDLRVILARSPNWREVLHKSDRSGITSLVYYGLKQTNLSDLVPPDVWASLRRAYVVNGARNLILNREAESLLAKYASEGVPIIALKGLAFLNGVYPTIAVRRMCDVDLLVRPEHMERAAGILVENGFVLHERGDLAEEYARDYVRRTRLAETEDGISVELHQGLVSEKAPFTINMGALWERAVAIRVGGTQALALSVEDEMHHLAAHLFGHHFAPAWQWRNMCDLAAILQRFGDGRIDWDYLLRSSHEYRTAGALFLALNSLDSSLKAPEVWRFLERLTTVNQDLGISEVVDALSRHLPRYDYEALALLPSTVTEITEEPSVLGKVRLALANLSSTKRLIAFHGAEEVQLDKRAPLRALRSLSLLTKYNLNSIRMAYLVGKVSREMRRGQ